MTIEEHYQKTLDYLYSFVDFSLTRSDRYTADQFNLSRMYDLVSRLDNPQAKYPIIHIAGTKGKGSVAAMCHSALVESGYRTGLYTSPHLHDYAERIQVNGVAIPHRDMVDSAHVASVEVTFDRPAASVGPCGEMVRRHLAESKPQRS